MAARRHTIYDKSAPMLGILGQDDCSLSLSFDLVNRLSAWLGRHARERTGDALETDPGSQGPSMTQNQSMFKHRAPNTSVPPGEQPRGRRGKKEVSNVRLTLGLEARRDEVVDVVVVC
jgi:hypothetical protein